MNYERTEEPHWYVLHTYSGYEKRVKDGIEAVINNRDLHDEILEIKIPMKTIIEIRDGKEVEIQKMLYPGYVLVNMHLSDKVWYIIRNTRGVTGFVGPDSKPTPLKDEELMRMGLMEKPEVVQEFSKGDEITVTDGPLKGFRGVIEEVISAQNKVRVNVSMFGRETPTELDFKQIKITD